MENKEIFKVNPVEYLDRETVEGEQAWVELTTHHCLPFVKDGMYYLERFWLGYSSDPYENLKAWREDAGVDWDGEGLLAKLTADHILKIDPSFQDWEAVVLDVRW